jgi:putative nucleotidyltransferase with HDIG domain
MQETLRISVKKVKTGMVLADSVYATAGGNLMIARKDMVIDYDIIDQLDRYEISFVTVYTQRELGKGTRLLGSSVEKKPEETPPPEPKVKFKLNPVKPRPKKKDLRTEAIEAIRDLFIALQTPGMDVNLNTNYEAVRKFENVLSRLVSEVDSGILKYIHIQELKVIEDFPYFHSLAVAMLSVATGKALGFDTQRLLRLAKCAILHDIGKPHVPQSISGKKGKLTPDEFSVMKEHSVNGALNLKTKGFGDSEIWNGIMFHHEKTDGSGYPKKLTAEEIPLFSKIIAVADTYDAVTSIRPHRQPMSPAEAFELISSQVGKSFDFEIVKAFTKNLQLYPIDTKVELSDGRFAVVTNNDNVFRPTVKSDSGEFINLGDSKNLNLGIVRVV